MTQKTTLIQAQFIPAGNDMLKAALIYPGIKAKENKKLPTFITSNSPSDFDRRLGYYHKVYILSKLRSWLNQRAHVRCESAQMIINMQYCIDALENQLYVNTYRYVKNKYADFISLAPSNPKSRSLPYFQKIILPILEFCKNSE